MKATTLSRSRVVRHFAGGAISVNLDPLGNDEAGDDAVATSRRGLARLALVAAEAGARFQREGVGHDPLAWMLAPRRLFRGAAALDACLERDNCLKAVMLHGLSVGLDAAPSRFDPLLAEGNLGDGLGGPWKGGKRGGSSDGSYGSRRLRLYSATIMVARGGELLHAFHASVAPAASVVRERIRARLGTAAAEQAKIRIGFDAECPVTMSMVPPAIVVTLTAMDSRLPWSTLSGIDITVEQRLSS